MLFGENVRAERKLQGWSIRSLAAASGTCADTIFRIEHGGPSTMRCRQKVCDALQASYRRLVMASEEGGAGYAIHRRENDYWSVHYEDRPYRVPEDEEGRIQKPNERDRLGRLGFVRHFVRMLNCRLPHGKLVAGVLELYGEGTKSNYLAGEVLVFVLFGNVRVVYGEESFELTVGESATIECAREDFCFEPASSPSPRPPTLLYVRLDEGARGQLVGV